MALKANTFKKFLAAHPYLGIFFLALLLRLVYLVQALHNNPLIDYPQIDAHEYLQWAQQILNGHFLYTHVSYTPLYPLYLAFFLALLKNTALIFAAFHVIGALQAVLIGKIAERVFSRAAGIVAAVLAATYWPFIVYEATFHAEHLALIATTLSLYFFIEAIDHGRKRDVLLSGFFFAVAALVRSNLFAMLPLGLLVFAWQVFKQIRSSQGRSGAAESIRRYFTRALASAGLFLVPTVLMVTPILGWNYHLTGTFILRDQGTLVLFLGNNPDYQALSPRSGLVFRNLLFEPGADGYSTQKSQQGYWLQRTLKVIRERPGDWLVLQGKKLLMQLNAFEISNEFSIGYYRSRAPVLSLPWPGAWLVLPLGLVGLVMAGFADWKRRLLALYLLFHFISIFPAHVTARYRLPEFPVLIMFGAFALVTFLHWLRTKQWRPLAAYMALLALLFAVTLPDYLDLKHKNRIHTAYQIAHKAYDRLHNPVLAKRLYQKSMQLYDDDYNSAFWLAYIHFQEGNTKASQRLLQGILEKVPDSPDVWWLLAENYFAEGNLAAAKTAVENALRLAPTHPRARALKETLERQHPAGVED